ncbi:PAN domain-containing protein [Maritimibacter fusiformis]|uniref:Apple domain-containing protein n=1 Tax=Maritimibacter fusiformis TaxID=2603819 RepID=A0A5D0RI99_9RHOB|nr:PAN domain-containing protein [Maritimibacter fusiformis]TYB81242.1 hypothetical protein FVF75_08915 [Maritimibacter fusiformis]
MGFSRLRRARRAVLVAAVAALSAITPALADYTRGCNAEVRFVPQNASQTFLVYTFSVHRTVDLYAQVNQARRIARGEIINCLRDHWDARNDDTPPPRCTDRPRIDFRDYPFASLEQEMTRAMCNANLGVLNMTIGVEVHISGQTGCYFGGGHDPVVIAQNVRIICLQTIPGGGGSGDDEARDENREEVREEERGDEPAEPPAIGDAGGWERVDRDEDEPPADEPPADDAPPATARYLPLPNVRLPGNDLYLIELDAPNWLLCRQACTEDDRCGAWTYRQPSAGSGPICLIKSRAGVPFPDTCCRSGVKQ